MARRIKKGTPELNASSMADIAFLLLIFFLVTTTMDIDKGILVTLPPWLPDQEDVEIKIKERDVLEILVNARDQLLVENELMELRDLKETVKKHVDNNGVDENFSISPQDAVVSLQNDNGTTYRRYLEVYNEIRAGYNELRNTYAERKYKGLKYDELTKAQQKEVRAVYPLKLSEADQTDLGAEAAAAGG